MIIEYWASFQSHHHGTGSQGNKQIQSESGEKYVHEFSLFPRARLTQEEVDAINTGSMEIGDWKKVKPLPASGVSK